MTNAPIASFRNKGLCVSVWETNGKYYIKIDKSFYDKKSKEWNKSDAIFDGELEFLVGAICDAGDAIKAEKEKARKPVKVEVPPPNPADIDKDKLFALFQQFIQGAQNGSTNT